MPKTPVKNVPDGMRPIGARLLKSAIDTLRPQLSGAKVLDLFAGQGRFGFECLNEDADSVTFVELSKVMHLELKKQAGSNRYKNQKTTLLQCDAFKFLQSTKETYDIVFADPPFEEWNLRFESKFFLAVEKVLSPEAILLVKCPSGMIVSQQITGLTPLKETEMGESKLLYYRYGKTKDY